jgi:hypothetical protein
VHLFILSSTFYPLLHISALTPALGRSVTSYFRTLPSSSFWPTLEPFFQPSASFATVKKEVTHSYEILVTTYQATSRDISEDRNFHDDHSENLIHLAQETRSKTAERGMIWRRNVCLHIRKLKVTLVSRLLQIQNTVKWQINSTIRRSGKFQKIKLDGYELTSGYSRFTPVNYLRYKFERSVDGLKSHSE